MAYDKVVDSAQLDADLASVASKIKEKASVTEGIDWPQGFLETLDGIVAGDGDFDFSQFGVNFSTSTSGSFVTATDEKIEQLNDNTYIPVFIGNNSMPPKIFIIYRDMSNENLTGHSSDVTSLVAAYIFMTYTSRDYLRTSSPHTSTKYPRRMTISAYRTLSKTGFYGSIYGGHISLEDGSFVKLGGDEDALPYHLEAASITNDTEIVLSPPGTVYYLAGVKYNWLAIF